VGLFSRKLGKSQLNWTPREKETYAIVAALQKWAGTIGFQPVTVTTDHRALESWVTEHVDTPSGPRGRRARWHETLSQFDLEIRYIPGPDNVVADALSRWAYPASSAREDVSFHGSAQAKQEVDNIIKEERTLAKMVGVLRRRRPAQERRKREEGTLEGQEGREESPPMRAWQPWRGAGKATDGPHTQGLRAGHEGGQEGPSHQDRATTATGADPKPREVWPEAHEGRREGRDEIASPTQMSPITLRSGRKTQEDESSEEEVPGVREGPSPPEEASSSTQLPRMTTRRGGSSPTDEREPAGPRQPDPTTNSGAYPLVEEEEPEGGDEGELDMEDLRPEVEVEEEEERMGVPVEGSLRNSQKFRWTKMWVHRRVFHYPPWLIGIGSLWLLLLDVP
jgi:hypothetical protein